MYYNYYVIGDVIQVVPAMVTYNITTGASIHGGDKLFASDGFSYTTKRTNRKNETV